jgi:methionyl-tRNA synthetase
MGDFRFDGALAAVWELISYGDKFVDSTRLWELPQKDSKKFASHIAELCALLANISVLLEPFLPTTSQSIADQLGVKLTGSDLVKKEFKLKKGNPLFPMAG